MTKRRLVSCLWIKYCSSQFKCQLMFLKCPFQNDKTIQTIIFKEMWHTELSFNFKCGVNVCWNLSERVFHLMNYCSRPRNLKATDQKYTLGEFICTSSSLLFFSHPFRAKNCGLFIAVSWNKSFPVLSNKHFLSLCSLAEYLYIHCQRLKSAGCNSTALQPCR